MTRGRLPIGVCNLNASTILIPQGRPLANVFQVDPNQIQGEKDLVLKPSNPGLVEVDVQVNQITLTDQHPVNLLTGEGLSTELQQEMDSLLQ